MSAPHFSINLLTGERRQHIPMNKAARALARPAGSAPTNQNGCIQIEIMGTCAPVSYWERNGWKQPAPYLPDMNDSMIEHLARLLADIARAWNIPLRYVGANLPFPQAKRTPLDVWPKLTGVIAHQDGYAQSHVDTGQLPIERIMARANQILNPPPPPKKEWDEMASKEDFKSAIREVLKEPAVQHDLARAVLLSDGIIPGPRETTHDKDGNPIPGANTHVAAATNLQFDSEATLRIERAVNAILAATKPQE
jgi:hypothetical protein